jgi:hypothetical protein
MLEAMTSATSARMRQPWFGSGQTPEGAPDGFWESLAASLPQIWAKEGIGANASPDLLAGESEEIDADGRVHFVLLEPCKTPGGTVNDSPLMALPG